MLWNQKISSTIVDRSYHGRVTAFAPAQLDSAVLTAEMMKACIAWQAPKTLDEEAS
jgi:hypothetical protein